MSKPVKIVVMCETAQAAANLRQFVSQADSGLKTLEKNAGNAGKAGEAFEKLGQKVYYARGAIDAIRFAAADGGTRAAFYALDETFRGLMSAGIPLATLVPIVGAVAAAVGAGVLLWRDWTVSEREAAAEAKRLAEAWKELPPLIEKINALQKAGLLSGAAAGQYKDMLEHPQNYYKDETGKITSSKTHTEDVLNNPMDPLYDAKMGQTRPVQVDNQVATSADVQKYLANKNPEAASGMPDITKEQLKESTALVDDVRKANEAVMDDLNKKLAQIEDKRKEAKQKILDDAGMTEAQLGQIKYAGTKTAADAEDAIRKNNFAAAIDAEKAKQEAQEKTAKAHEETLNRLEAARTAQLRDIKEAADAQAKTDKDALEAAERTAELKRQSTRDEIDAQLAGVQGNPVLTDRQKAEQSAPLMQQKLEANVGFITDMQAAQAKVNQDTEVYWQLQEKINAAKKEQAELENKIRAAQGENSVAYQMADSIKGLQDQNNLAKETAQTFSGVFNTAVQSVSRGISQMILYTGSLKQRMQEVGQTILTSIVEGIVQMGVRWLITEAMMALGGRAIMAAAVAASAPMATAQSAIWATPATLSTIATFGASAAAAPEEIALAQATTLGMAGFAAGGYTGDGSPGEVAGLVHRGEFVVPADVVDHFGVGALSAMTNARPSSGGAGGAGPLSVKNIFVTDPKAAALEALASPAGEKVVITHVNRNKNKMGFNT